MTVLERPVPAAPARPAAPAAPAAPTPTTTSTTTTAPPGRRIVALDAVRGLAIVVMLLAMNPGPRDGLWSELQHPEWHGVHLVDTVFPLFLFAVGASLPFASRATTPRRMLRRTALLFGLGVGLQLVRHGEPLLHGVLQHIAVTSLLAWLALRTTRRTQLVLCTGVLVAYWLVATAWAPGDPWGPDAGFAHDVNGWFFGGFRTEGVPQAVVSTVNVIAGAWVGDRLRRGDTGTRLLRTVSAWALALVAAGLVMSVFVPLGKHLWTPSFAVLTAGTSCGVFAVAYWAADMCGRRRAMQPLVHLGSNALAAYIVFVGLGGVLADHRGPLDDLLGGFSPSVLATGWAIFWVVLATLCARFLYDRKVFIRI